MRPYLHIFAMLVIRDAEPRKGWIEEKARLERCSCIHEDYIQGFTIYIAQKLIIEIMRS